MNGFLRTALAAVIVMLVAGGSAFAAIDAALLDGLKARTLGPAAMSGRIAALDVVVDDPNHIVVGAATGGVWISDDGGLTWTPVFDGEDVASIGAVAINQSNPDIIWVGTGEGNVRNSTSIGGGMYKSVDGGDSWIKLGLERTERINRIALHPTNPDIAYIAAMGALWGENSERGIYKTTDGGETWSKILYVDQRTGASDVKIDPTNPDKLFASMWEFRRWPYFFKSGGPGSGLHVSYDAGETWMELTQDDGLPEGELGRATFAISPTNPDRVYAIVEAEKSAIIRSDDGGKSWATTNADIGMVDRPFYYTDIYVDPVNPDRLYNVSTRVRVSIDGGKTFEFIPAINCCAASNTIHIDNHAYWINPSDPRHMILGNDGGIAVTHDRGDTWRFVRNLPLAQFYHIAVDDDHPYNIYGGLQDNGSWRGPAEVWENGGIRNLHWQEVAFGDGFDTLPDPENSRRGYAMSQGGFLYRWNLDTGEMRLIRPDHEGDLLDLRFNWNAGLAIDPFDSSTIYYGSQYVHKSTDRGGNWETISTDLTTNNPEFQTYHESGGLTPDVTAAENYTTITAIAPSPLERGVIWVGTDDGRVHVTRDGGATWESLESRARGVPRGAWVPMITPSPHDPGTAFIVFDDHRRSNMETYAYRIEGYGRNWTSISGDNDLSGYALSILQDPVDANLLFLGTEFGLFVSLDGGRDWTKWTAGVPTVSVMDMAIQARESDLVLGTHGRAIFVIDDYSALRSLSERDFGARFRLLDTTDGQQYDANQTPSTRFTGSTEFRADNEPYGVMITFMASGDDLPHPDADAERARKIAQRAAASDDDEDDEKPSGKKATFEILTTDGEVIRTFKAGVNQGINRVVWGMSRDGVRPAPSPGQSAPEDDTLPPGASVLPGTYRVRASFNDESFEADVQVLKDPRSPYSQADMEANYAAFQSLQELSKASNESVRRIVDTRRDVDTLLTLAKELKARRDEANDGEDGNEDDPLQAFIDQGEETKKGLKELEKRFRVPPPVKGIVYDDDTANWMIGMASFAIGSTWDAPSSAAQSYAAQARSTLEAAVNDLNAFIGDDVAALKASADENGVSLLSQSPVTVD